MNESQLYILDFRLMLYPDDCCHISHSLCTKCVILISWSLFEKLNTEYRVHCCVVGLFYALSFFVTNTIVGLQNKCAL